MAYKTPEQKAIYNRTYYLAHAEEIKKQNREWAKKHKKKCREIRYAWKRRNKEKIAAHDAVKWELKMGRMVRPEQCQRCHEKKKVEAHHHKGYEKAFRLVIMWLYRDCHQFLHREGRVILPPQES